MMQIYVWHLLLSSSKSALLAPCLCQDLCRNTKKSSFLTHRALWPGTGDKMKVDTQARQVIDGQMREAEFINDAWEFPDEWMLNYWAEWLGWQLWVRGYCGQLCGIWADVRLCLRIATAEMYVRGSNKSTDEDKLGSCLGEFLKTLVTRLEELLKGVNRLPVWF